MQTLLRFVHDAVGELWADIAANRQDRAIAAAMMMVALCAGLLAFVLQAAPDPDLIDQGATSGQSAQSLFAAPAGVETRTTQRAGGAVPPPIASPADEEPELAPGEPPIELSARLIPDPTQEIAFSADGRPLLYPEIPAFSPQVYTVDIRLLNRLDDSEVSLDGPLLVALTDYRPPETREVYLSGPMGSWAYYYHLTVQLRSSDVGQVLPAAAYDHGSGGDPDDVYLLEPGQVTALALWLDFCEAGEYTFRVGVAYSRGDQRGEVWAPETLTVQVPERCYLWSREEGGYSHPAVPFEAPGTCAGD